MLYFLRYGVHRLRRKRVETALVSAKFQIVIPRAIRQALGIRPGHKVQIIQYGGRIEIIPVRSPQAARGFLKGIDTSVPRDTDR